MSKLSELRNLEHIRHALSTLDLKGTDETVTMTIMPLFKLQGNALAHISVGQRPTIGCTMISKAVSLAHFRLRFFMCKAFSLDYLFSPLRRALPYASMYKTFGLMGRHREKSIVSP